MIALNSTLLGITDTAGRTRRDTSSVTLKDLIMHDAAGNAAAAATSYVDKQKHETHHHQPSTNNSSAVEASRTENEEGSAPEPEGAKRDSPRVN